MRHELFPHQNEALAYAIKRRHIALFLEQRLGKCVVTAKWSSHHRLQRVLLVAPLSTLRGNLNWEGELRRSGITLPITALPSIKKVQWQRVCQIWHTVGNHFVRGWKPGWFLINYEALLHYPELLDQPWDGIVLDESTRIRNPKAQATKILTQRTGHIVYRALLSGLPNPESPTDYFAQFRFLDGTFMGHDNYWEWRHRYFHEGYASYDWRPNKGTRDAIRDYVHGRAFILSRKTAKVGSDKVREVCSVPLSITQKRAMKTMRREFALAGRETKWITVVHTWMQKLAGGFHPTLEPPELMSEDKLKLLSQLVLKRFAGQPVVVWFRFNHEIEAAYHYLIKQKRSLRVAYVHGAMKNTKTLRVVYQQKFQEGKLDVLLVQVKLGKYGWNLSRANTAIYYSNSYEFEDRAQSEDRIIHLSKTTPCLYIDLVTKRSTDEDVVEALAQKRLTARMFGRRLTQLLNLRMGRMVA